MTQGALMSLAREATSDFNALLRVQALSDRELRRRGLTADEVAAIRGGFLERLAQAGSFENGAWRPNGCCFD
ncbi:MAG TPA: hypothetical protein VK821_00585 [Dehalococcoidia bacterium]|nr:hypothetical protein [Dehalococcoidia bacterium]